MKANDIRNGQILRIDGKLFRVLSFQHRTPGNLRAFVQAKLRDLKTGAQNEFRFSSTEELERVSASPRTRLMLCAWLANSGPPSLPWTS